MKLVSICSIIQLFVLGVQQLEASLSPGAGSACTSARQIRVGHERAGRGRAYQAVAAQMGGRRVVGECRGHPQHRQGGCGTARRGWQVSISGLCRLNWHSHLLQFQAGRWHGNTQSMCYQNIQNNSERIQREGEVHQR
jgi:hypothetical protein